MNQKTSAPNDRQLVLYIEDNLMNVDLAIAIFDELPDIDLITAVDAESGIDLALSSRPDLIIMDIDLPGMDGKEATRVIKQSHEIGNTPIIALSAAVRNEEIIQAMTYGFVDYVTKPIELARFLKLIHRVLGTDASDL
ncbi:MAG: response regulator [Gammaproteobacteria bacterium]|nr:response regulator [Gammaproteobacteria bacterium]